MELPHPKSIFRPKQTILEAEGEAAKARNSKVTQKPFSTSYS